MTDNELRGALHRHGFLDDRDHKRLLAFEDTHPGEMSVGAAISYLNISLRRPREEMMAALFPGIEAVRPSPEIIEKVLSFIIDQSQKGADTYAFHVDRLLAARGTPTS